jgi:hypothetical protein
MNKTKIESQVETQQIEIKAEKFDAVSVNEPVELINGKLISRKPTLYLETWVRGQEQGVLAKGIQTSKDYRSAGEVLTAYKQLRAQTVSVYNQMLKPLNERRGVILEWKRSDLSAITEVDDAITNAMQEYQDRSNERAEQRAKQALEIAEADAKEKRLLELEELRDIQTMAEAEGLNAKKQKEIATEIQNLEGKALPPLVVNEIISEVATTKSLAQQKTYKGKLLDPPNKHKLLLVQAVAEGRVPLEALKINDAWINSYARAMKTSFDVPGFELVVKKTFKRKGGVA